MPGTALPTSTSAGRYGATSNWSKVPCSRSRATDSAVTSSVTTSVTMARMPGTKNLRLSRLGLYHARITRFAGGPAPEMRCSTVSLYPATTVWR